MSCSSQPYCWLCAPLPCVTQNSFIAVLSRLLLTATAAGANAGCCLAMVHALRKRAYQPNCVDVAGCTCTVPDAARSWAHERRDAADARQGAGQSVAEAECGQDACGGAAHADGHECGWKAHACRGRKYCRQHCSLLPHFLAGWTSLGSHCLTGL